MLNIILITHEGIASSMMNVAESIIGSSLSDIYSFEVPMQADPVSVYELVRDTINASPNETLIITDLVGSTPYNVAIKAAQHDKAGLVCGLNLPMLLRVINYRARSLEEVMQIALDGGKLAITLGQENGKE